MNLSTSLGKMLVVKWPNGENQCLLCNFAPVETDSGAGGGHYGTVPQWSLGKEAKRKGSMLGGKGGKDDKSREGRQHW